MQRLCSRVIPNYRWVSSIVQANPTFHNSKVILADFREEKNSLIKEIFRAKLHKTLSYPDVLPNDVYLTLMEDLKDSSTFPSIQNRCVTEIASIWGNVSKPDTISQMEPLMGSMHYLKDQLEVSENSHLKTRYFGSILEQKLKLGFCLFDEAISFDSSDANLMACINGDEIILSGQKVHVCVGESEEVDAYLLFAHTMHEERLITLLLPSNTQGIRVSPSPERHVGYDNLRFVDLNFDGVTVSKACLLSDKENDVMEKGMLSSEVKIYRAAQVTSVLKSLLNEAIKHSDHFFLSDSLLSESRLIRNKLSKVASRIYALESMVFISAGLADFQKTPDYKLDATSVKLFADSTAQYVMKDIFDILGLRSCCTKEMFHKASRQLYASSLSENDNIFLKVYLGTMAVEDVSNHPNKFLGVIDTAKIYANHRRVHRKSGWELYPHLLLKDKVHPSLELPANTVENAILYLNGYILQAIKQEQTNEEELLLRIGEAGTLVHSMLCSLIRASHAYCIGLSHNELDKILCQVYIYECNRNLRNLLLEESNVPPRPYAKCIFEVLQETQSFVSGHPLDGNRDL